MIQRRPHAHRRSFVIIAVLVIVGSAILVATSLLFVAQTEAAGASGTADAAQSRALVCSGLQAVMSRINDQRDRILVGDLPDLEPQYTIFESGNRAGVVRLMVMEQPSRFFIPESGRIDLNAVDADRLVRSGLLDVATASAFIVWRDQSVSRPIQSVNELLHVPGGVITAEMMYGSLADFVLEPNGRDGAMQGDATEAAPVTQGLAEHVTVFTAEPNLQQNGRLRINLNQPWSEELARLLEERFGRDAADLIKRIYESGTTFESDAKIVQALRSFKTPPEEWPPILDAFTTQADEWLAGRVNINVAGAEALQTLPAITPELAQQLISVRKELSTEERASVAWPVLAQIITPEAFEKIIGLITTRSWCYRVRLEAGTCPADQTDGPLDNRVLMEAVVDFASPRPRIAYMRDITMLEDTVRIAYQATMLQPIEFERSIDDEGASETLTTMPEVDISPTSAPNDDRQSTASEASPKATTLPPRGKSSGRVGRWIPAGS